MLPFFLALVELQESVLIGAQATLCATIATMAVTMWAFMQSRLKAQDLLIAKQDGLLANQGLIIANLQRDVDRMSKGCGADGCVWKHRD